ncbi:protein YicC [Desulfocucumis palustris]|uniref:Protein YicC n=1 Tax=Desulfocucumis palustris TaxID=1898651 RepID=A0A2L2X960_9FIRM|nr:YicC/YloC family endoribonuclease [Desulfocucumis palustris]GBF32560.1 protein YicC [Desulfocucumis palustris]
MISGTDHKILVVNVLPMSMTGFGRGEATGEGKNFTVEMKSVNHRFCEVMLRMPRGMAALEEKARRYVQSRLARGRIDIYVSVENSAEKTPAVKVDKVLAASYYKAMEELLKDLGITSEIKPEHLFSLPNVISLEEPEEDVEAYWPVLEKALAGALDRLLEMRETEGTRLRLDLLSRLEQVKVTVKEIEQRSAGVVEEYRLRLTQRLQEWLNDSTLDINRLMAEVAVFAERSSITEEVVRLYSHIDQAAVTLKMDEPVGRKLDFLLQEMNREINTIASKASDLSIAKASVEVKSELEKIREQVQNLE